MKTLEEFVIKEIEDLRRKVETLEAQNQELNCIIDKQNEEYLENKAFIEGLKKDLDIRPAHNLGREFIRCNENYIWDDNEKYKFYKQKLGLDTSDDNI